MSNDFKLKVYRITGAFAIAAGITVIMGWHLDISLLKSVFPSFATMKINTAIGIMACGMLLLLYPLRHKGYVNFFLITVSLFVLMLSIATLLQYVFPVDLGIDRWLAPDTDSTVRQEPYPGRMPISSAICLGLYGYAFLAFRLRAKALLLSGQWAFHLVTLICFVTLLGYLFSVHPDNKLPFLALMAVHSALIFFLLSIAASTIHADIGITWLFSQNRIGNTMARKMFPVMTLIMIVLGYLRITAHRLNLVSVESGILLLVVFSLLATLFLTWNTALSLNRTDEKKKIAEEKLITANRLYSFISHINQTIVYAHDAQVVFDQACNIAVRYGNFESAIIWMIDTENRMLRLAAYSQLQPEDVALFTNITYAEKGPVAHILETGSHYLCNNIPDDYLTNWKAFSDARSYLSCMALPIKCSGSTVGVFFLFAPELDFFGQREVELLIEATGDISFSLDVFEKEKQIQRGLDSLRHSEQRLKEAQEIAHVGSWELDFQSGKAVWSEEALRIHGLPADAYEQPHDAWLSFVHPDDRDYVLKVTGEQRTAKKEASFFYRIIRRDGTIRYILAQSLFDLGPDGMPSRLHGVVHDVTEIKESERALLQAHKNVRQIIDLIPQAIFAKEYSGRFIFANKYFAELYDKTPEEIISETEEKAVLHRNSIGYFIKQDQEVIDEGVTHVLPDVTFVDRSGNERHFYTTKVPYTIPETTERAVLGIGLDLTKEKKAEAERMRMVTDIVQRNKDLEQFSYIISHNLRLPVANIIGLAGLLPFEDDEDEKSLLLTALSESAAKLDDVIKDLNFILQVRSNVSEIREFVVFSAILSDINQSIHNLMEDENVRIIADFNQVDGMFSIKSYLYSIFLNLINNSIKYRQHGIQPVIEIVSQMQNGMIRLTFKDNGMGIDLEAKGQYVFGLYKRFHQHTEGKGMGLFMVKTQVESLGGKISVDSQVNKGTIFTIIFEQPKSISDEN